MPTIGVVFYFSKAPRFIPENVMQAKVFALVLLTVVLPILLFFLLKSINRVKSIHLESARERVIPLALYLIILYLIIDRVLPANELIELYYFIVGIMGSTLACLMLAIMKYKASIHMIAAGGVLMYFIALSVYFQINIIGSIALIIVITGAVASSRLHLRAHNPAELIIGFLIGMIPQLITLNYWL